MNSKLNTGRVMRIIASCLILFMCAIYIGILEGHIGISFQKDELLWKVLYKLNLMWFGMIMLDLIRWIKKV